MLDDGDGELRLRQAGLVEAPRITKRAASHACDPHAEGGPRSGINAPAR